MLLCKTVSLRLSGITFFTSSFLFAGEPASCQFFCHSLKVKVKIKECFFLPLDGGGVSGSSLSSSARRRWWISLRLRFSEEGGPPVKCLDRVDPCVVDEESLLAGDELR